MKKKNKIGEEETKRNIIIEGEEQIIHLTSLKNHNNTSLEKIGS